MTTRRATYFDSRIDYRITNPGDVPDGNTIAAQRTIFIPRQAAISAVEPNLQFGSEHQAICNCRSTVRGVYMVNLLRRFIDVFHIDSIDMNALTGNARMKCFVRAFAGHSFRRALPALPAAIVVETRCIASLRRVQPVRC
jgi:hypothetical protein